MNCEWPRLVTQSPSLWPGKTKHGGYLGERHIINSDKLLPSFFFRPCPAINNAADFAVLVFIYIQFWSSYPTIAGMKQKRTKMEHDSKWSSDSCIKWDHTWNVALSFKRRLSHVHLGGVWCPMRSVSRSVIESDLPTSKQFPVPLRIIKVYLCSGATPIVTGNWRARW